MDDQSDFKVYHLERSFNPNIEQDMILLYNQPAIKKRSICQLQGIASAVIYDGVIADQEVEMINAWLKTHQEIHNEWPTSRLIEILKQILSDTIVTQEERRELFAFLTCIASPVNTEPSTNTLNIFHKNPTFTFPGKSFLFTGELQFGKRNKAEKEVIDRGGLCPGGGYKRTLDYLVVGELGNEAWKYGKFGNKIEACMTALEQEISKTIIAKEIDFIGAILS